MLTAFEVIISIPWPQYIPAIILLCWPQVGTPSLVINLMDSDCYPSNYEKDYDIRFAACEDAEKPGQGMKDEFVEYQVWVAVDDMAADVVAFVLLPTHLPPWPDKADSPNVGSLCRSRTMSRAHAIHLCRERRRARHGVAWSSFSRRCCCHWLQRPTR
eukprot:SAG31_NODE_936_length_10870_cov_5.136966_3_plen_158_part_00